MSERVFVRVYVSVCVYGRVEKTARAPVKRSFQLKSTPITEKPKRFNATHFSVTSKIISQLEFYLRISETHDVLYFFVFLFFSV